MSVFINKNNIEMTRGDTLSLQIAINKETDNSEEPYVPQTENVIRFAVKRKKFNIYGTDYADPEPLILKVIPNDTLILTLDPEDTKPLGFGEYVYDIQITFGDDGVVDTFISGNLRLTPEVD